MLQADQPQDYVIGTGESHSVEEFVEEAFRYIGLDWHKYVKTDPRYFRPLEVDFLQADSSKARRHLSWQPKVTFKEIVRIMVDADLEESGQKPVGEGKAILGQKFGGWHRWDNSITRVITHGGRGAD